MKKVMFSAVAVCALMLSSCALVSTPAGIGGLYTSVKYGGAISGNTIGKKVGTSSASNILGLICSGDASIQAAARNGGIKKISHVDQEASSILGLFGSYKTVVYGD